MEGFWDIVKTKYKEEVIMSTVIKHAYIKVLHWGVHL
jgi:hypothetical protein